MKSWIIILCLGAFQHTHAQHKLRIEVSVAPPATTDSLFLTGNFNYWKPADPDNSFIKENGKWVYERPALPRGVYEFKFSRGASDAAQAPAGNEIRKNILQLISDTVLSYTVYYPLDQTDRILKTSTSSENVHTDSLFNMNDGRKIWIYLPSGYKNNKKRYSVIYMLDGPQLFDEQHATVGEWGIDETMDSLATTGRASIIVGIDNLPKHVTDLNDSIKINMEAYLDLIIKNLKPHIDKRYRTLSSKENTSIAGSGAGGLVSYYATLKYPNIFGRAGMFSPSFHPATGVLKMTDTLAAQSRGMFFFYRGELEENMEEDVEEVILKLGRTSNALLYSVADPDGRHNRTSWRKWFPEFYLWVTSNGLDHIIR